MNNTLLKPNWHDTSDSISMKNKLQYAVAPNKTSDLICLKNKLKYAGPPTLKKKSYSKNSKKNLNNVGTPTLHKISDPVNMMKKIIDADKKIDLKSLSPSDRIKASQKGKQSSQSTSVEHKQCSEINNLQSENEVPVDSEIVDYPINLTGKGYL